MFLKRYEEIASLANKIKKNTYIHLNVLLDFNDNPSTYVVIIKKKKKDIFYVSYWEDIRRKEIASLINKKEKKEHTFNIVLDFNNNLSIFKLIIIKKEKIFFYIF